MTDVVGDLGNIGVIQSGINFVKYKERSRLIAVKFHVKRARFIAGEDWLTCE